jgi:hypothetical protein
MTTTAWITNLDRFEQGNRATKRKQPRHSLTTGTRTVHAIRANVGYQRKFGPAVGARGSADTPVKPALSAPTAHQTDAPAAAESRTGRRGAIQGGAS